MNMGSSSFNYNLRVPRTQELLLLLLLWTQLPGDTLACGRGSVFIVNNEYRGILIAISEEVPENPKLLNRIRKVFTEASAFLYQITRQRAFFKDIKVLIPETWSDQPEYQAAGQETLDKSDILVQPPDSRFNHGDQPFVIKTTPCGELGYYMHLTPDYLLKNSVANQYGDYDKTIVHEWAHLRYGVYNEYPSEEGGAHFYAGSDGEIEATRCTTSLSGSLYNYKTGRSRCDFVDNLPEPDCRFLDSTPQTNDYGSLMYRQYLDHVVEFCDNDPSNPKTLHNPEAPTLHNQMCSGRSVWEVLRDHPDFAVYNQPAVISDTTPDFTFVRKKEGNRFVLVLDISGSMKSSQPGNKIGKLGQGCSNFISNIVRDGEKVGVVVFNGTAYAVQELVTVNSTTRSTLLSAIPTSAQGSTSIGAGIEEGLSMLGRDGDTTGGILIVVSDGIERTAPWIRDVWNETIDANVTLHSIAITDDADSNMDAIAIATGGLPFLYSVDDNSNALNEAFQTIGEITSNPSDRQYTIQSTSSEVTGSGGQYTGVLSIDASLGRNTEFIIDYSGSDVEIVIMSPSGEVYNQSSNITEHDSVFGIYRFEFPGIAEQGEWSYTVTNPDASSQRVAVSVTSQSSVEGEYPIVAQAFWAKRNMDDVVPGANPNKQTLFASVSQGYAPVLGAEVVATVDRPSGATQVDVVLLDNGAGADITKNDGIYSAYFIQFNTQGRYNVKIAVNSTDTTVVSPRRIIGQSAAVPPEYVENQIAASDVVTGQFQRTASGGAFELASFTANASEKLYPPSRITDLKVTAVDYDNMTVTLEWTAVGAELDVGTASEYELRYSLSFAELAANFSDQSLVTQDMVISGGNLTQPLPAGGTETLVIQLAARGDITYAFGIVALDNDGRNASGELSNIVTASLRYFPPSEGDTGIIIVAAVAGGLFLVGLLVTLGCVINNYCRNKRLTEARRHLGHAEEGRNGKLLPKGLSRNQRPRRSSRGRRHRSPLREMNGHVNRGMNGILDERLNGIGARGYYKSKGQMKVR